MLRTLAGLVAVSSFSIQFAFALSAPDFSVTFKKDGDRWIARATPPAKHHINDAAPIRAELKESKEDLAPAKKSKKEAVFIYHDPESQTLVISLYLCDDANTFCEKHTVEVSPGSKETVSLSEQLEPPNGSPAPDSNVTYEIDAHGFIVNNPVYALDKAKKEHKPLMVDFFGIWCPPCNQLEASVFSSKEFKKISKRFVLLRLDGDRPISWTWKSKYKIPGYPTLLFLSPEEQELGRQVGFVDASATFKLIRSALKDRDLNFRALTALADGGDRAAADRLGLLALDQGDFDKAIHYLSGSKENALALRRAEVNKAVKAATPKGEWNPEPKKVLPIYEKAAEDFPDTTDALSWLGEAVWSAQESKNTEKEKEFREKIIASAKKMIANPLLIKGGDWTLMDVWETLAEALSATGQKNEAIAAYKSADEEWRKRGGGSGERGSDLELAYCLWNSGDLAKAREIYERQEKKFPKEFTFYYAHARMLAEQNQWSDALPLVQKAFEYSYGDNRIRAATLYGKTLKNLDRKKEAKDLVHSVATSVTLPDDPTIFTHRLLSHLKELETSL